MGTHGVGPYSSNLGSVLQFISILGKYPISVSSNSTNAILSFTAKFNNGTCAGSNNFFSAFDNASGTFVCNQVTGFLTNAILSINGNTGSAQTISQGQGISITNSGSNHTIATNFKVNNITCAANNFVNTFSNSTGNYGCGAASGTGITSINGNTNATQTIQGTGQNVTVTSSSGTTTINTGSNIANLVSTQNQTFIGKVNFTKTAKLAPINIQASAGNPTNLKAGDIWINSNQFNIRDTGANTRTMLDTSLAQTIVATKTVTGQIKISGAGSEDVQTSNALRVASNGLVIRNTPGTFGSSLTSAATANRSNTLPDKAGTLELTTTLQGQTLTANANCGNGQTLQWQSSNSTWICRTLTNASAITSINSQTGPAIVIEKGPLHNVTVNNQSNTIIIDANNTAQVTNIGTANGLGIQAARTNATNNNLRSITCGSGLVCSNNATNTRINSTAITSAITSINSQTGPAININRGNMINASNVINSTNTISYQLKPNILLTNASNQLVTKVINFTTEFDLGDYKFLKNGGATDIQGSNSLTGSSIIEILVGNKQTGGDTFQMYPSSNQNQAKFSIVSKNTTNFGTLLTWETGTLATPLTLKALNNGNVSGATVSISGANNSFNFFGAQLLRVAKPVHNVDVSRADNMGIIGSLVTTNCANNQALTYQSSNTTWVCRTLSNQTGITSINGTTGAYNINLHTNATIGTLSGTTLSLKSKPNMLLGNGSTQQLTKTLQVNGAGILDLQTVSSFEIASSGMGIRNPAGTFMTTIKNSPQTANNSATLQILPTTPVFISMIGNHNYTSVNANKTAISSLVPLMLGANASLIPKFSDNMTISVRGTTLQSTSGDGCRIELRWFNSPTLDGNKRAVVGTALGLNTKIIGTNLNEWKIDALLTGLTAGTKVYTDVSVGTITGGTCTETNVEWRLDELS